MILRICRVQLCQRKQSLTVMQEILSFFRILRMSFSQSSSVSNEYIQILMMRANINKRHGHEGAKRPRGKQQRKLQRRTTLFQVRKHVPFARDENFALARDERFVLGTRTATIEIFMQIRDNGKTEKRERERNYVDETARARENKQIPLIARETVR